MDESAYYSLDQEKLAASMKQRLGRMFAQSVGGKNVSKIMKGYEQAAEHAGPESFVASIPMWALGKVFGKERVQNAAWKYVSKPAMMADTYLGSKARKIPGLKGMFTAKEQVPWGEGLHKDVSRASITAPLQKARAIAAPIIVGVGAEKGIRTLQEKITGKKPSESEPGMQNIEKSAQVIKNRELREKVASTMLRLNEANKGHEKRAEAVRLLYKRAELGIEALPQTYGEFETKVASLVRQDLALLDKALELAAGNVKLGELSGSDLTHSRNADAVFQAQVLE